MTIDTFTQINRALDAIRSAEGYLHGAGRGWWWQRRRSRANAFSMLYEARMRLQTLLALR
jgi:hypothetical protein